MDTTTATHMPAQRRLRTTTRFLVGNWPARVYLALVLGTVVYAVLAGSIGDRPDASLAGVWPFLATAPTSVALIGLVPDQQDGVLIVANTAAGDTEARQTGIILKLLTELVSKP